MEPELAVSNLKKHFCELLKKYLKTAKAKQLDIAKVLDISPSAVSQMLRKKKNQVIKQHLLPPVLCYGVCQDLSFKDA